jgi:two-component system sensor histidine kinase KdpD
VSIEAQKEHLLVSIADRGPGIPQGEREHIFEKFYRISRKANAPGRPRGLGLGLAICRGIIDAHRGQIWVQPREGGGSVFCFTLPLNDASDETLDKRSQHTHE